MLEGEGSGEKDGKDGRDFTEYGMVEIGLGSKVANGGAFSGRPSAAALQSTISLWLALVGLANSTVLILSPSIIHITSYLRLPARWTQER